MYKYIYIYYIIYTNISVRLASRQFQLFGWSDRKLLRDTFQSFEFNLILRSFTVHRFQLFRRRGAAKPEEVKDLGDGLHTRPVSETGTFGRCCFPADFLEVVSRWFFQKIQVGNLEIDAFFEKDSNFQKMKHLGTRNDFWLLYLLSIMLFRCFCFSCILWRGFLTCLPFTTSTIKKLMVKPMIKPNEDPKHALKTIKTPPPFWGVWINKAPPLLSSIPWSNDPLSLDAWKLLVQSLLGKR